MLAGQVLFCLCETKRMKIKTKKILSVLPLTFLESQKKEILLYMKF